MSIEGKCGENFAKSDSAFAEFANLKPPTEKDVTMMNLKSLLWRTEGQDKCTICNAIREIEKNDDQKNNAWPLAAMLLFWIAMGPVGGEMFNDEALLKALNETLDKYSKNNENGENDVEVQK